MSQVVYILAIINDMMARKAIEESDPGARILLRVSKKTHKTDISEKLRPPPWLLGKMKKIGIFVTET